MGGAFFAANLQSCIFNLQSQRGRMTLAELRALIRLTVGSAERWPDATLDAWIRAAIRLYGAHFGEREMPAGGEDAVDVPAPHLEALTAYVDFAAAREMQMEAAVETDGASITLGQLGDQARRAWVRYKDVMDQLVAVTTGESIAVSWMIQD
jgi:hypothetical protein